MCSLMSNLVWLISSVPAKCLGIPYRIHELAESCCAFVRCLCNYDLITWQLSLYPAMEGLLLSFLR